MIRTKVKLFASTVCFVAITMLVLYIAVSIFTNARIALGAPQEAPVQQAAIEKTIPPYLNYQGTVRDPEGKPMSGLHKITFRIYDRLSAPTNDAVWSEEHAQVMVRNGFFSVQLGQSEPLPPALFVSPDTFIGVTVDPFAETMPRQRFASVPYAMYADYASALNAPDGKPGSAVYVDAAGAVGVGTTAPQAQLHISSTAGISPTVQLNTGDQQLRVDENGLAFDGNLRLNSVSPLDILLATAGGQVGIGLTAPQAVFHILAPLQIGPPLLQNALQIDVTGAGNGSTVKISPFAMIFSGLWSVTTGAEAKTAIQMTSEGRIGIGTAFPQARLGVQGGVQVDKLNVGGRLLHTPGPFFTQLPVVTYRFTGLVNGYDNAPLPLTITPDLYDCVVMGWYSRYIPEDRDARITAVWTYVKNNRWYVRARFPSYPTAPGAPAVDVVCFHKNFAEFRTPDERIFEGAR